jgi:hypothetical protein
MGLAVAGTMAFGHGVIHPSAERPDGAAYVCTIGAQAEGPREELIRGGMADLEMPPNPSPEDRQRVLRARQACLSAVGSGPGKIDGFYGPHTEAAEKDFSAKRGGVIVNWESPVFRRLMVTLAMEASAPPRIGPVKP